jgi:hypothetical protein
VRSPPGLQHHHRARLAENGKLPARRTSAGHRAIPFGPDTETTCRHWLTSSSHIHPGEHDRQPGEISIAELAARLGVKPDHRVHRPVAEARGAARSIGRGVAAIFLVPRGPAIESWLTWMPR